MSEERKKIGSYELVRLLGKGGMSEVYEVENVRLGSRHALKLFTYEKADPEVRERFQVEGKLLARLNHPRIVKVTDFGEERGRPYFVMDLVLNERGEMQLLADVEPGLVDEETVGKWYDDLREGLAYIHANGVIHRDLKLQNVLIGPDGHAVLTDFGISKIFDAKGDGVQIVDTVRTLVKVREGRSLVMGSLGYMAPELEMGVAASPQSDWYALGVIVYRLLTGTWCDARTDVVGTLETYDPVWKHIIPKLLHSNPNGRECLSYADRKRSDRERKEFELEERWLAAKGRAHVARHVARGLAAVILTSVVLAFVLMRHYDGRICQLEDVIDKPDFFSTCEISDEIRKKAAASSGFEMDNPQLALVDAWVLTHGIFEDLKSGKISMGKAKEVFAEILKKAKDDDFSLYDDLAGYHAVGERSVLVGILENACQKLAERP